MLAPADAVGRLADKSVHASACARSSDGLKSPESGEMPELDGF
jgi:hypothetical protein